MPRQQDEIPAPYLQALIAVGPGAPSLDDKVQLVKSLRQLLEGHGEKVDRVLIEQLVHSRSGLVEAQVNLEKLRGVLDRLSAVPWHPAVVLDPVTTSQGSHIVVIHGNAQRVVGLAEGIDAASLKKGAEVFLGNELNVVMTLSPRGLPQYGEIAMFERRTPDGRLILQRPGDNEVVVDVADPLQGVELQSGDLLRWNREYWMAFEKLPRAEGSQFLLQDVPDIERDQVGGQDENLEKLLQALTAVLVNPEKAASYGLTGRRSVILVGPPGCGKTLMVRVAASAITKMSGKRCHVMIVKPGEWEDPFVGVTQQKMRNSFEALRKASQDGLGLMFLDEIEAVGRTRGGLASHHSDKFLAALLAELDGFANRSNVAVVAATNRKDLVDPALLERMSDVEIPVGRPDMRGARRIFEIHLPASLPYNSDRVAVDDTRNQMIETAVSRFYSPNAGPELCVLRFRDGKARTITARELASGRGFEQICRAARQAAFWREMQGGAKGLCVADIETAVSDAMEKLTSTLTLRNAHAYLSDLPQDVDVVAVDPVVRKVRHPHRYLNVA